MKRFFNNAVRGVVILSLSFMAVAPAVAVAAPSNSPSQGQALEIAPPVIYLSANPGQTVTTRIFLRDITKGDLVVTGQANDFVAAGEDGAPKVLLNNDSNNPYSLKNWVTPPASLLLVPHEIKTMAITFNVPANASPGGHYGIIRFTATPPSLKSTGVSLSASLGSLVLFTVNGKINHQLAVKGFSATNGGNGGVLESAPVTFTERIQNKGNEHEQPTGTVTVTDMFGRTVGAVNVNRPPKNILPSSTRKFEESFDQSVIGNKKLFGRYTAKLDLTYGTPKKTLTDTLTFWVIPYKLIAAVALGLVALFFILRSLLRRYNRRIIEKARNDNGTGGPAGAADAGGPEASSAAKADEAGTDTAVDAAPAPEEPEEPTEPEEENPGPDTDTPEEDKPEDTAETETPEEDADSKDSKGSKSSKSAKGKSSKKRKSKGKS